MRRRLIVGIVLVLIVAALVVISNNQSNASQAAALANVQTGRVLPATLSLVVESSGSVIPEASVTLAFDTSGTVSAVNVQPGDQVKQGDVLAQLDTSDLERQVALQEQAYLIQQATYSMTIEPNPADIAAAQTTLNNAAESYQLAQQRYTVNNNEQVMLSCINVDNAKRSYDDALTAYNNLLTDYRVIVRGTYEISPQKAQLDRAKAAYDQTVINCDLAKESAKDNSSVMSALAQLESARVNLDRITNPSELTRATAQAQLDNARNSLEQARRQLDKAQIVAPFDGVVTQVNATVGGPGSGTSILLADVSRYHVDVLVDETEIAQVQIGQRAEVEFDALPDVIVTGEVSHIDPVGTISQGVVNYAVRVDLDPTEVAMRIDMTTNVRVILDTHERALAVPGGALRSDGNIYYVNVVDENGEPQRVDVSTGYTDGDLTEVSGDLQLGQAIFIGEPPQTQQQQQSGFNLFGLRIGGR